MFIGEAPGKTEDRHRDADGAGKPFHGDAGQELNEVYLPAAGLRRRDVHVTNTVRCIPDEAGGNPSPAMARCCAQSHLPGAVAMVAPEIIVTLGAVAYNTMFPGRPSLEQTHGIPVQASYSNVWEGVLIPMYHPAAGLRSGRTMTLLLADFAALGRYLTDGPLVKNDPGCYMALETPSDVDAAWAEYPPDPPTRTMAMDTEVYSLQSLTPYCLSWSTQPGYGFVIRHGRTEALRRLRHYLTACGQLLLHNAPFDIPIIEEMLGARIPPWTRIVDTMAMAYSIGSIPQGLKQLALRLAGVHMLDFEDVVRPYWFEVLVTWLERVLEALAAPVPVSPVPQAGKRARKPPKPPKTGWELTTRKARNLLEALRKPYDPDNPLKPWERWQDWHDWDRETIARRVELLNQNSFWREVVSTSMPEMSISHVPWSEVVPYAGADADLTLRLWPALKRLSLRAGKKIGL